MEKKNGGKEKLHRVPLACPRRLSVTVLFSPGSVRSGGLVPRAGEGSHDIYDSWRAVESGGKAEGLWEANGPSALHAAATAAEWLGCPHRTPWDTAARSTHTSPRVSLSRSVVQENRHLQPSCTFP